MAFFSWSRWLRSVLRPQVKPIRRPSRRLDLEQLETRLAPAQFVWNGGAGDGNWASPANWAGGIAPSANDPGPDDLVFPAASGPTLLKNNVPGTLHVNSITFSATGYTLTSAVGSTGAIVLGTTSGNTNGLTGQVNIGFGETDTIAIPVTLGGNSSGQQTFNVAASANLIVQGALSNPIGVSLPGWTKAGPGTLQLTSDNSGLTEAFTIAAGITQITNNFALGTATGFGDGTTVSTNAQLQIGQQNVASSLVIPEFIRVNGPGVGNKGAIYNIGGNNTINGNIELDSDATFAAYGLATAAAFTQTDLTINGVISDLGSGHNITKEGLGIVGFFGQNVYRGTTTINNGILQVGNPNVGGIVQPLGTGPNGFADDSTADGVTVNITGLEAGTLQIVGPANGTGVTILNKLLTLNGQGLVNTHTGFIFGALDNLQGNNTWTGNVLLASPPPNGSPTTIRTESNAPYYTLTISGVVQDPYTPAPGNPLTKIGKGVLDFMSSNTYGGTTTIKEGILEIEDSQGLGPKAKKNATSVFADATLELSINGKGTDSLTGNLTSLNVYDPVYLWGRGAPAPNALGNGVYSADGTGLGALYSQSGINTYFGAITTNKIWALNKVPTSVVLPPGYAEWNAPLASIGVAPDPNQTATGAYFTTDFSLTISGGIFGGWEPPATLGWEVDNSTKVELQKLGAGQLILPTANKGYDGQWDIRGGWVTIENTDSLGILVPGVSQNDQPVVTVDAGAALQIDDVSGKGINLHQNFNIAGSGVSHAFNEINQQGAIESIQGVNTIDGNVVLNGVGSFGSEQVFGAKPSQLTTVGPIQDQPNASYSTMVAGTITSSGTTGCSGAEDVNVIQTGSTSGSITISYNMFQPPPFFDSVPDSLDVYYGIWGETAFPSSTPIFTTAGRVFGSATVTIPYGVPPGSNTYISVVIDRGNASVPFSYWDYQATVTPGPMPSGGLTKYGSGMLDIQGPGFYTGPVSVQGGVLLDQNNTALGSASTQTSAGNTVTVAAGAAIAMANGTAYNNGGLEGGTQTWGQHLIINSNPFAQAITISGLQTGTFQLQFNNGTTTSTTPSMPENIDPVSLAGFLNALPSVQAVGGVTVTQSADQYTVTFKSAQPLMQAVNVTPGSANITIGIDVGSSTLGAPVAPLSVWSGTTSPWNSAITLFQPSTYLSGLQNNGTAGSGAIIPIDARWHGPVSLNGTSTIDVQPGSRLIIDGSIDDNGNALASGSDLINVDTGEVFVNDPSSYRGNTYVGTSSTSGTVGYDPYLFNEWYNGGNALPGLPAPNAGVGAVLTVGDSLALGSAGGPTHPGNVYIQGGSTVQLEGNVNIAGKTVYVNGTGLSSTSNPAPANWFPQGPAPLTAEPNFTSNQPISTSGRIAGVAVSQADPNLVYIATAGGGAWKTMDGGRTWIQIFDNFGAMFTGAIAIDPTNSNIVYLGTGEADNSGDSGYGTGIYQSTDGGESWTLLTAGGVNPGAGVAVSKILVDPDAPKIVYVATSDYSVQNGGGFPHTVPVGIWRWNGTTKTWYDMTEFESNIRAFPPTTGSFPKTSPGTPGPDDDFRLSFPQGLSSFSAADYSDLGFSPNFGILYMSLGTPGFGEWPYTDPGTSATADPAYNNAVYRCTNPETATGSSAHWYVGDGNNGASNPYGTFGFGTGSYQKGGGKEYPNLVGNALKNGGSGGVVVRQGMIKLTSVDDNFRPAPLSGFPTLYGVNTYPLLGNSINMPSGPTSGGCQFEDIWTSVDGGMTWNPIKTQPPGMTGPAGGYQGDYDLTVIQTPFTPADANTVYVGGCINYSGVPAPNNLILKGNTTGGGSPAAWQDITVDGRGIGPHTDLHASALDVNNNLYIGGDGGIYKYSSSNGNWTSLNSTNGSLQTITMNGIAVNPQNPDIFFAGAQDNGVEKFSGTQDWQYVGGGDGGQVAINAANPNIVYAVSNGNLLESTTGGGPGSFNSIGAFGGLYFPLRLDSVDPTRILVGGGTLEESVDGGQSFINLNTPIGVSAMASATFQGPYEPDSGFKLVADKGSNTYDPGTIYVTDGVNVYVTKDHASSWVKRSTGLPVGTAISDLAVDPRNRDNVYLAASNGPGQGLAGVYQLAYNPATKTYKWTPIGGGAGGAGLPDVPVWKLQIDPNTGNVYAGTDNGVYLLPAGSSTWTLFGTGLPQVSVRDMDLNVDTNTLTIATYGRGAFQIQLNNTVANVGGLVAVTGSSQWTGNVVLTGATTISAAGAQANQTRIHTAVLNIDGQISDQTSGANFPLTINTPSSLGTIIFSGPNTYGGTTDVTAGILVANNLNALGLPTKTSNTTVETGAALQLESSVDSGGTLILNGDGPQPGFNGHNTGALESIANNITYTGPIQLNTANVTIGVDSGSTLTLLGAVSGSGNNLTKELTGLLILDENQANVNTYNQTLVYQGALQVASAYALPPTSNTLVLDGAQLQLNGNVAVPSTASLDISGTGINGTGALLNVGGRNTWQGAITLDANPGFSPNTYPIGQTSFGVGLDPNPFDPTDVLTITGQITEATPGGGSLYSGLTKIGPDTLVLAGASANTYNGGTFVQEGYVSVKNTKVLGDLTDNGIQRLTVYDPVGSGTFTLSLTVNGQTATTAAIGSGGSAVAMAATVQGALNGPAFKALLGASSNVVVKPATMNIINSSVVEKVLTIIFTGLNPAFVLPQLVALATNGATAIESKVADNGISVEVNNGAALQLDLANSTTGNTITGETILLNGNGPTGNGALENVSGTNTWTGTVTLNSTGTTIQDDSIGVDYAGTPPAPTFLTLTGNVTGTASANLDKVGPGTLILSHANTYAGTTNVENGILKITTSTALGGPLTDNIQQIGVSGALTGNYQLTFTDQSGNSQTTSPISASATGAQVQAAIAALANVGVGNVVVTPAGAATVYTVTFIGIFRGQDQNPLSLFNVSSGTAVALSTLTDGGRGNTIVSAGATLQEQAGLHVSTEQLILNGTGFGGIGALQGLGAESWDPNTVAVGADPTPPDASIILASDSAIGAASAAALTIYTGISGNASLTKVGLGTMIFANKAGIPLSNTYSGLTTVADGTLQLDKDSGSVAVPHNLTVGDGTGAAKSATAQLELPNQFATSATVTVNSDGLFDANNVTATIGNGAAGGLVINDGTAQPGNAGNLTVNALTMTGGTLTTNTGGTVTIAGDVAATADAASKATITGTGTLVVNPNRTFNIAGSGKQVADLDITLPITGTMAFTQAGSGILELDANSTGTPGAPNVTGGTLQVDGTGKINSVIINGGTVGGTGTVGNLGGPFGSPVPTGTIQPGDQLAANPNGVLTVNPGGAGETWGSTTTFSVNLIDADNVHPPVVGTDYSQLVVNGNISLGGAQLTGLVGNNVGIGDSFIILRTTGGGIVSGNFADPFGNDTVTGLPIAYVDGVKFDVDYSNNTQVKLIRVKENATLTMVSNQPSDTTVYGQEIQFTASMAAEAGGMNVPTTDTVTFNVYPDATTSGSPIATYTANLDSNDQVVYNPQDLANFTVPVGQHAVTVTFNGDPNFNTPPPAQLQWTVNQSNSAVSLSPPSSSVVFGQPVTITAAVSPVSPGGQTPLFDLPSSPSPNVTFTIDPGTSQQFTVVTSLDTSGHTSISLSTLSFGTHKIVASYGGDINYTPSLSPSPVLVLVSKDTTSTHLLFSPVSPGTVGQSVVLTAQISTNAPGTATPPNSSPYDTVTFFDGTTPLGQANVLYDSVTGFYEATITTGAMQLAVGTHQIKAQFSGDTLLNASSDTQQYIVNQIVTSTTVVSSLNPSILNQQVVFTATVSAPTSAGPLSGNVAFYDSYGTPSQRLLGTAVLSSSDVAVFPISSLTVGMHPITAVYQGIQNYATSASATLPQNVEYSTTTSLGVNPVPATYGVNTVTLTATVGDGVGMPAAEGVPPGTVAFYVDGSATAIASATVNPATSTTGTATVTLAATALPVGNHNIVAIYTPANTNYAGSTSAAVGSTILSVTNTNLTSSANPSGLGNQITLTATIQATSPGASSAYGGTVTFSDFFNGNTIVLGTSNVNAATGVATLTTNSLALGNHAITASYSGNIGTLDAASSSSPLPQTVLYADTTAVSSSLNPSPLGTNLTFTATVTNVNGPGSAGVPSGTVSFYDGTTLLGSGIINNGIASFTTSGPLPVGTHPITATYNGNTNYAPSTSPPISQIVLNTTSTTVTVGANQNPAVAGQTVQFTAHVVATSGTAPAPFGSVTFFDNGSILANNVTLDASQNATFQTSSLSVGTHNITATYNTNVPSGYFSSTGTLAGGEVINKDTTSLSVSSNNNPSAFGQAVIFTGTITPDSPGGGAPAGTADLVIDGSTVQANANVFNGHVNFSPVTNLSVAGSPHSVQVVYHGDANFVGNSNILSGGQSVSTANTTTIVSSSANPGAFGQNITLTATVTPNSPGGGTPSGSVSFYDGGNLLGSNTLSSGSTTISANGLIVGTHTITAVYSPANLNYATSTGALAGGEVINPDATTTTLTSSGTPSVFTQAVTLTATVAANSPGSGSPQGSVVFYDSGIPIGNGPVSSGQAQVSVSSLSVGPHSLTAVFTPSDGNFTGSTSSSVSQQVTVDSTTTVLTSNANPSSFTQPVSFTATVTANVPGGGPASGSVTFVDTTTNQVLASNVALDSNGQAVFTTTTLPVGSHQVIATFGTTTSFTTSTSSAVNQIVNMDGSSTTLVSSLNPAGFGQSVTFTANVTAASPGGGPVTSGTVTFFDATTSTVLAQNVSLNGTGQAVFTTASLPVGTHSITATFGATGNFNSSTSNAVSEVIKTDNTLTSVSSSVNPSVTGQPIILTATVSAVGANVIPTGTVVFTEGATTLGSASLNGSGQAIITVTTLGVGSHSITASFGATSNFNASSGTLAGGQQVNAANTTTSLATSLSPSVTGQIVTFTATVTASTPGGGTPGGTVTFFDGANQLGTGTLNGAGQASIQVSGLTVGTHTITASYASTNNYNGSGATLTGGQTVQAAGTTTSLTSSATANSSVYTQSVTFTAVVAAASPGGGTPSGTVTFLDGSTQLGTASLNNSGTATLATSTLTVGSHSITAVYGTTTSYTTSTSGIVPLTVKPAGTVTTLTTAQSPTVYTQPVSLTATVLAASPASGPVTGGTVTFMDTTGNIVLQANVPVDTNGLAVGSTNVLSVGTHTITAIYNPSSNYTTSNGTTSQVVTQATTTTTLSASSAPTGVGTYSSVFSQQVTFTAVVSASPGTGLPVGTVTFTDGGTAIGVGTVSLSTSHGDYEATLTTTGLKLGTHTIGASFTPNAANNFTTSIASPITDTVAAVGTTTTVSASASPSVFAQAVTITAAVAATAPGTATPTGTVTITDTTNGKVLANNVTLVNGRYSVSTAGLAFGVNNISVTYTSNSPNFLSGAGSLTQSVFYASKTTVTTSKTPVYSGDLVTLTATVGRGTGAPTTAPLPSGQVYFYSGGVQLIGISTISAGKAILQTTALPLGANKITAVYQGDGTYYNPSTSAAITETVYAMPVTMTAVLSAPPTTTATPFTVTAYLYDINGNQILAGNEKATIKEISGPTSGFTARTTTFNNTTGHFTFANMKVARGGNYVLEISVVVNGVTLTADVSFNGVIGRLH
jgi:autotransporter-associated beta strand protein